MRVTIDLMKKSTQIIDLSNVINPRVGDDDLLLPLHICYGDNLYDMRGKDVEFLSQDANNQNIYVAGTCSTDTPGDNLYMGDLTFRFPAGTFQADGTYDPDKTMFRIVDKATQKVISSVNVKITVMKNAIEFNFDPGQSSYDSRAETMLQDFHDKGQAMLDEITDLKNQAKSNVSGDTAATANAAKQQANANAGDISDLKGEVTGARGRFADLPGREDAQDVAINQKENIANANANYAALQQKDAQQDAALNQKAGKFELEDKLAHMDLQPESFADLNAVKATYPNGATQLIITDDGHRAVYRNGQWIDGGIFQAAGPNPKNFWATYHFAVNELLEITKRNLITYDNLAIDTYLNSDTGDYLPNMSGYEATDYIAVKANTAYHLHSGWLQPDKAPDNKNHIVTFYNQNFEYLNKYYADTLSFATPPDACYLKVAFPAKEVGTLSLQMGTQYDWEKNPPELQIKPEAIGNVESSTNNLIDVTMPFSLNYGLDDAGNFSINNGFSTYDFINLKGAKKLSYSSVPARIAFYGQDYSYLSSIDYPDNGVEVPLNAVYMRVQYHNEQMEQQTDNGNFLQISPDAFIKEPSNGREVLKNVLVEDYHQPKFHLLDALNQWLLGREFPIGFLGDSTTEGDNTSAWTDDNQHLKQDQAAGGIGKVNYSNPTSYSYLTQQLLQQRTKNSAPEIYNMGWSGTSMFWMIQHFDEVFNNAYSDVRMVGIEYGINDRNDYGNRDVLAQTYRYDLIRLIQMLYDRGIQPFIVTSQAIWNHVNDGSRDVLNTLTLTTLINRIKKEVAREYHLELIDMQEVGDLVAKYSSVGWNSFNNGILHFKDLGHQVEARYIYGKITDELETVESGSILSYLSQRVLSDVYYGDNLQTADNVFKYTVSLNTSGKQLLQQFAVMNLHPQALQLTACCSTPDGQTVEVDGTTYQITSAEQDTVKLEPGPHIIRAFNDATKATTNWLGFKLR
ncbi:SGNH/GDSL hydrolase family protein [Limosilactobacillus fermentum]